MLITVRWVVPCEMARGGSLATDTRRALSWKLGRQRERAEPRRFSTATEDPAERHGFLRPLRGLRAAEHGCLIDFEYRLLYFMVESAVGVVVIAGHRT